MSPPKSISVHSLIKRTAAAGCDLQESDGSFPPGSNTVYDDPESPVRATSHWLTILLKAFDLTGKSRFLGAADSAVEFLTQTERRPHGYTFLARKTEEKDKCNGLIGQSMPIKALAHASQVLNRPELATLSKEVFKLHPFNRTLALWERVDVDGTVLSFDRTFNHQAIFAARSATLADTSDGAKEILGIFLDNINDNIQIHSDGVIRHYVRPPLTRVLKEALTKQRYGGLIWNEGVNHYYALSEKRREKEIGYQPVNLSAFATLKQSFPDHPVWESKPIRKAIDFVLTDTYAKKVKHGPLYGDMKFGKGIANTLLAFRDDLEMAKKWLAEDIYKNFDFDADLYQLNTNDPMFQAPTISILAELPNLRLERENGL